MVSELIYDIIVVGAGPAGWRVAIQLVKNGMSAALVENELVGGECNYWACVPSKALLRPPEALTEASEVEGAKQAVHGHLSAESVLSRRNKFVDNWDDSNMKAMVEKAGVVVVRVIKRVKEVKPAVIVFFTSAFLTDDIQYRTGLSSGRRIYRKTSLFK